MKQYTDYIDEQLIDRCSIGESKLVHLYPHMIDCMKLDGAVAELGVYRGGTFKFMARVARDFGKLVFGFDTFTGTPFKDECDVHNLGDFQHPLSGFETVKQFLGDLDNIRLIKGIFVADIIAKMQIDEEFCFVHIDVDQYRSTAEGLMYFYPRMVSGGKIILDDYTFDSCPGVEIAAKELGHNVVKISALQGMIIAP